MYPVTKNMQKQESQMLLMLSSKITETLTRVISLHEEPLAIYNGISKQLVTRLWFSGCKQVNGIKPFQIKVQFVSHHTGLSHAMKSFRMTSLPMKNIFTRCMEHSSEICPP